MTPGQKNALNFFPPAVAENVRHALAGDKKAIQWLKDWVVDQAQIVSTLRDNFGLPV